MPSDSPLPDRIGPYRVLKRIGAGAMGEVYLGQDGAGQEVAIKVMAIRLVDSPDFLERFHREFNLVAGIDHPNIARAMGSGEFDGQPYLAMEYIRGPALDQVLKQQGPLTEATALRVAIGVAKGLEFAYQRSGLIHRDIKPANILIAKKGDDPFATPGVDENDLAKVIDFGLAKSVSSEAQGLTMTGAVMGTPHYMAPEQIRGEKDVDVHADIYALGATLYHLLTGAYPYPEPSPGLVMTAHLTKPVPDPGTTVRTLSKPTRELVMTAMQKRPGDRFLTYRAFLVAAEKSLRTLIGTDQMSATRSRRVSSSAARPISDSIQRGTLASGQREPSGGHPTSGAVKPGTVPGPRPGTAAYVKRSSSGSATGSTSKPGTQATAAARPGTGTRPRSSVALPDPTPRAQPVTASDSRAPAVGGIRPVTASITRSSSSDVRAPGAKRHSTTGVPLADLPMVPPEPSGIFKYLHWIVLGVAIAVVIAVLVITGSV
ncbi:hypothetical protein LBMAG53_20340 [Planctomycetota bacterium]|nr:hypothetical protein LBMAG53_20340 [Planctomycetota bacterium]